MSESVSYLSCKSSMPNGTTDDILGCVALGLEKKFASESTRMALAIDRCFLIYAASLMFFMQAGFAILCAGSVRRKNVQNTLLKNLLDSCGAAIGYWSVGFAFSFGNAYPSTITLEDPTIIGDISFVGNTHFFMADMDNYAAWLFQFAFAATSATIVAGTLAERCQMVAYISYSILLTGFVYPVVVHSVWSTEGFLSVKASEPVLGIGMIDFAGSGVVHVTGGMTALIATKILGPRKNRFYDERGVLLCPPKKIMGHSVSLQVLGTFLLWFGWFGFNAGSSLNVSYGDQSKVASLAAVSTALGGASGCLASLTTSTILEERRTGEAKYDVVSALNGVLAGLVSVTGGAALFEPWAAVLVGSIGGLTYLAACHCLEKLRLDDAVHAIPVHLACGIWGVISVGLFASPNHMNDTYQKTDHGGLLYHNGSILATNLLGVLLIIVWVTITMTPFFLCLSYLGLFRSDPLEEIVGLDISYHGASAIILDGAEPKETERAKALADLRRRRFGDSKDMVTANGGDDHLNGL
eukprot:CAMPEP_0194402104 /NCGR_PEP_ID=MMETSP0176-20130528/757_1 /TAXON_ID=216777 /ORGANISM="Proboscia alata, Strain PI-D3" /LENGTH=523 /DNA_ID=CAMNT_0039199209 /DNA_START=102 /DNA_END=1673 /DNA_ORIENTATION=-